MLGTKEYDKEGDCIIPTRIPSSAVETGQCPNDQGTCRQVRRAELKGQKALRRAWKEMKRFPGEVPNLTRLFKIYATFSDCSQTFHKDIKY